MTDRPLLMIPGPIEVSPAVLAAAAAPPRSHVAADFIEDFGTALARMREVWLAAADAQPFVLAGSGTLAMEMAVANLIDRGDRAVIVNTGYFSDRMAEMVRRRGAAVSEVRAEPGAAPDLADVETALADGSAKALFATHVDTSTGVRVDARALAELARRHGVLSVFDGVCATAGERFSMAEWGADIYLTASQKAIGLPPGLALLVASQRALAARERLDAPPPLALDFREWAPIFAAYEARKPAYFATPATTLVAALRVGLDEILGGAAAGAGARAALERRFQRHERVARALRAAWAVLGLEALPKSEELAAHTLSALYFPAGVGPDLVGGIRARGVIVAGGLLPALKSRYFRVGHMGHVLERPEDLLRTVRAVAESLAACEHRCNPEAAVDAARRRLADGLADPRA